MKSAALTGRLEPRLADPLDHVARKSGVSRSDLVRDLLRRQLAICDSIACAREMVPLV